MDNTNSFAVVNIYESDGIFNPGHVSIEIVVNGSGYHTEKQIFPDNLAPLSEYSMTDKPSIVGYGGLATEGSPDGKIQIPPPGRIAAYQVIVPLTEAQALAAKQYASSQIGVSTYVLLTDNCKTYVDAVLVAGGYTGDWTSLIPVGVLSGHSPIELILSGYYDTASEKLGAEFPDIVAKAHHELNTDGGGPSVDYVRAVLSGDPQAIARTAMELTGGQLNLYDGMDPGDVGVYPDLILRVAAGLTEQSVYYPTPDYISEDDYVIVPPRQTQIVDDEDEEEEEPGGGGGPTQPTPEPTPRELPMRIEPDGAGRQPNDPNVVGPRPRGARQPGAMAGDARNLRRPWPERGRGRCLCRGA